MCRLGAIIGDLRGADQWFDAFRGFARENPHGFGIGGFVDGVAHVEKSVGSALEAPDFGRAAWIGDAASVVMHVRKATVGAAHVDNAHPFEVGGRLVVHNGTFGEASRLDAHLGARMTQLGVRGETDSERMAALFAHEIEQLGGDEVGGYRRAVARLADEHPMTSLTSASTTADGDLLVLRYPENRTVFWRRDGDLAIVASRPLDADAGWRELEPGKLLRIRARDLGEEISPIIDREPAVRYVDRHVDVGMPWNGTRRSTVIEGNLDA